MTVTSLDRARGALLGLAAGDALGTTLEFTRPGQFTPLTDMVGGGPFHLKPGEWTDDTSMALCLAESLVERGTFDPLDQLLRYRRWWKTGHLSVKGYCFDIGGQTRKAMESYDWRLRRYRPQPDDPTAAGNGSIMRLAPVAVKYADRFGTAVRLAGKSSAVTHGAAEAVDGCRYLAAVLVKALQGGSKAEVLEPLAWADQPLSPRIQAVADGSFKFKSPPQIRGSGYVVHSLEAALWAFYNSLSFEEGALLAVNLGEDADTTGAVYGQIAGAYYGASGIPKGWVKRLAMRDLIERRADELAAGKKRTADK